MTDVSSDVLLSLSSPAPSPGCAPNQDVDLVFDLDGFELPLSTFSPFSDVGACEDGGASDWPPLPEESMFASCNDVEQLFT